MDNEELINRLLNWKKQKVLIVTDLYNSGKYFIDGLVPNINPRLIKYKSNFTIYFKNGNAIMVRSVADLVGNLGFESYSMILIDNQMSQKKFNTWDQFIKKHGRYQDVATFEFRNKNVVK